MARDEATYPSGMYWVVTRQLGLIGRNEAGEAPDGHLHGSILFLRSLVGEELEEEEDLYKEWEEIKKGSGEVSKRERYQQLDILVRLMKRIGLLREEPMKGWDLEAFQGEVYGMGEGEE